jgi:hypothetical protein
VPDARRLHERYAVQLPVTVKFGSEAVPGRTVNISLGGMLLDADAPVPFGAEVVVLVAIPQAGEHELPATVRWSQAKSVGLQFHSLRAKATWALNQLFKTR